MKSYLLLRDNQESGPYTLDEIRKKKLQPFDLIWIEGESKSWCYPTEVKELSTTAKTRRKNPSLRAKVKATSSTSSSQPGPIQSSDAQTQNIRTDANPESTSSKNSYFLYEDVARELFTEAKPVHSHIKTTFTINRNVMGLMLIFIGVVMGSFVVKNIVESFGTEGTPSETAKEIQSMTYQSDNAAYAPQKAVTKQSLINNIAPVKTDSVKKVKVHPVALTATQTTQITGLTADNSNNSSLATDVKTDATLTAANDQAKTDNTKDLPTTKSSADNDKKDDNDKKEVKKLKDIRSMVHVSSNNYKVGLLGGVSDIEIQVNNDSPVPVDRATVEVRFLKPNGSVIKTETIEVNNIARGKSKKVQVPSSSRGTKVQFRINSVSSHDADAS